MKIAEALLNKSEEMVLRELESIADDNGLRVFAKPRLSDVILKGSTILSRREFEFYTRAHVDFVVADEGSKPIMIVEYDGPFHTGAKQLERDKIKDTLCVEAGLGILRINANHVTRLYRGISVLRWIVEVTELQKWFDEAQAQGQIPYDEIFDPASIFTDGRDRKWPYWLSVTTNQAILSFLRKLDKDIPKGRAGVSGTDERGNQHNLSFLWFGDQVIWTKTAIREQNVCFPAHDLLDEIAICDLGIKLNKFQRGEISASTIEQFKKIHTEFWEKYRAGSRHSMGGYPFNWAWDSTNRY